MFVFCGLNFNNKHFLWICEGKISKHEVEGEEFAPWKGEGERSRGRGGVGTLLEQGYPLVSKIRCNEFIYSLLDSNRT